MKNLIVIALLIFSFTTFAQETPRDRKDNTERRTLEQRNQFQLKKVSAELNLSSEQQKEMAKILAEKNARHESMKVQKKAQKESGTSMSTDERLKMKSAILDHQIATNARLKELLSAEQYAKWESNMENRHAKNKNRQRSEGKSVKTKDIAK